MRFIKSAENLMVYAEELSKMAKKLEEMYIEAETEGYTDDDYTRYQDLLSDMQTEALQLNTEIDEIRRKTLRY